MNELPARESRTDPAPGTNRPAKFGGVVRTQVSSKYLFLLFTAWVLYAVAFLLPSMAIEPPNIRTPGWKVFLIAAECCVIPVGVQINLAAWIGTLSNVVMLILSPIFRWGGKGAGKERFFDVVALVSGLWVWMIPLLLDGLEGYTGGLFLIGYYLWATAHLMVGTRIFWPKEWYNNNGLVAPSTPKPPRDDWFKDQTGDWDERR